MLVPKKDRLAVYSQLFKDGVMVAKEDLGAKKHIDLKDVPNLHVVKLMQSLMSRGYVKKQFSWCYYYYFLTDEGIEYLRGYLNLPSEIIPATLKKPTRAPGGMGGPPGGGGPPGAGGRGGGGGGGYGDKKMGPGGEFRPSFREGAGGGVGRGAGGFGASRDGGRDAYRPAPGAPQAL